MSSYVLGFRDIDQTKLQVVGGKGANLGELCKVEGVHVPDGFCISAQAFQRIIAETSALNELLDQLSLLKVDDRAQISELSRAMRRIIEGAAIPQDIWDEITRRLAGLGEQNAYAVRSSATAEDLPTASFAGQQDTYLNIIGTAAILQHISKCWASLFTERAVIYRLQNGFDHRQVLLAVVVQQMVFPQVAGILFTADPVTANRTVSSIEAGFGLGEALVAGLVNADSYTVRDGTIRDKQVATKRLAIYALPDGGTHEQEIAPEQQNRQALRDAQILHLVRLGRQIEAHFGCPQDIEWCLADDAFYMVQSRPITTLYPIPQAQDQKKHVYVSVGHQQMMTDRMKPLGWSVWQLTASRPMYVAGGRLFVDIADELASPAKRVMIVNGLGKSDPLIKDALLTLLERGDFISALPADTQVKSSGKSNQGPPTGFQTLNEYDPTVVSELITQSESAIAAAKQNIQAQSGPDLLDFILEDFQQLRKSLADPRSFAVIMTAMNAAFWINEKMEEWLGEKNVADTLSQSVPNNITSEMGLELLDVADVIRPYPEVVAYLQQAREDSFWDGLLTVPGGKEACAAIHAYLTKFGMRGVGEIDITRTRWSEKPTMIIPLILRNVENFAPGASKRKFEQGRQEALTKEQELIHRLRQLPAGQQKAEETQRMIHLIRNLSGYREYPKYAIVQRYFVYKQALLKEAERLVQAGVMRETEDLYYLTFDELREVVRTQTLDHGIIGKRKDEYTFYEKLTPPRVLTSDGEIITGAYKRENLPAGAMVGLAVSSGVIEGRARIILNMEDADLEAGDILVTTFTDPSWTAVFVLIKGLVTEVGGLMTHGAVIAREYGITAVVGVDNATKLIKDGQRIRVHGTEGYVEIL